MWSTLVGSGRDRPGNHPYSVAFSTLTSAAPPFVCDSPLPAPVLAPCVPLYACIYVVWLHRYVACLCVEWRRSFPSR
ncbi:hypothetical protein I4F81_002491 [Pyropia yezoensis]|uniref:Uncharacterized protein n=1 Tax=Pyropia yezoensis TaxID=2788 RepID=A0ACC3BQ99_PYRYE|nr:hypothetical protein I4F81_002491 [Neopyropia yezoensis]